MIKNFSSIVSSWYKKGASLLLCFLSLLALKGQATKEDIYQEETKLAWLGLDFTKATFRGLGMNKKEIKNTYIPRWNGLLGLEWDKFDIEAYFGFKDVNICFDHSLKRNWNIEADGLVDYEKGEIKPLKNEDVHKVVKDYQGVSNRNLGLLFVVEQFNKFGREEKGVIWVTFLDIKRGKLLLTKRLKGRPGGRGKVNYWIGAVFQVLEKASREFNSER